MHQLLKASSVKHHWLKGKAAEMSIYTLEPLMF